MSRSNSKSKKPRHWGRSKVEDVVRGEKFKTSTLGEIVSLEKSKKECHRSLNNNILPVEKETLYAYLAVSVEAVGAVLLTDRKRRQCHVQLRRYFEAYLVKVNTDQPIKNNLNNTKTSEKLAKYAVELEAYNITFMPRNAVKG
nr:hypothetical protein [Tanacetum cinerariifolium]